LREDCRYDAIVIGNRIDGRLDRHDQIVCVINADSG
jgi:hypothetical protein